MKGIEDVQRKGHDELRLKGPLHRFKQVALNHNEIRWDMHVTPLELFHHSLSVSLAYAQLTQTPVLNLANRPRFINIQGQKSRNTKGSRFCQGAPTRALSAALRWRAKMKITNKERRALGNQMGKWGRKNRRRKGSSRRNEGGGNSLRNSFSNSRNNNS